MDLIDRLNATAFLGSEFLTWVWFRSDQNEGLFEAPNSEPPFELFPTARLVMSTADQAPTQVVIRDEDPGHCPEARLALKQGKKVIQGSFRVVRQQREWAFTIKGENLALSSIQLPAVLRKEDDERHRERLYLIEQLDEVIDGLFQQFVALRQNSSEWSNELVAIRAWIQS
jgi:hypothetical protein